jgi:hypothetical protein
VQGGRGGATGGAGPAAVATTLPAGTPTTPPLKLTASDRGVTPTSVKIVFPWFEFDQSGRITGSALPNDAEDQEQAIRAYVNYYNATGGIGGRKIDPIITDYNPVNDADMRNKCIQWADDNKVFGVVDSEAWHSGHQLCLTEEKDTPLVTSYTTVNEWPKKGAPYLWWTGPSTEEIVEHWVLWAKDRGFLNSRIGVAIADRAEDKIAMAVMEKALARAGAKQVHWEVLPYDNGGVRSLPAMPGAVQRMKANADHVFMMLSFTLFAQWLTQSETQDYYPKKYLLSDLAQTLIIAEALIGGQFPRSLNGAEGPTYAHLGMKDTRPDISKYGYTPSEAKCNEIWRKAYPNKQPMGRAGLAARWCQNIGVFVEGARRATAANNGVLTRKNWGAAMATLKDFPGIMTPILSYSATDRAGPTQMKTVMVVAGNADRCRREMNDQDPEACHIQTAPFGPMRHF